jgi:hypothetical protein
MKKTSNPLGHRLQLLMVFAVLALSACAQPEPPPSTVIVPVAVPDPVPLPVPMPSSPEPVALILTGASAVPAVETSESGRALVSVQDDGTLNAVVVTTGMPGEMVTIEDAAAGAESPVVATLVQAEDGRWHVPEGIQLTEAQKAHYQAGQLYANVRTQAHPTGEIRGRIQP